MNPPSHRTYVYNEYYNKEIEAERERVSEKLAYLGRQTKIAN